jgi:flagellar basal body-associated protein FliL
MNQTPSSPPQYEPGGDRIMIVIVLIVVTALGGMLWSFFSRQNAPHDAPEVKTRHLPPSARPEPTSKTPGTVPPAPTLPATR